MSHYFGSKATSGLCQPIIAMMPPHDTYIETHLGGGAIMKRKPPALSNIGIDLDPRPLADFACDYCVQRVNECAHHFLKHYEYCGSELVYCDPPYLTHTRSSGRRYRFDYEEQDHIELLTLLKTLPCNVILSGYPSTLYDDLLEGWHSLELQVMNQGGVRTEKLWHNYRIDRVHWASFAGKNFTDRQRIKRKAANWGKTYRALPRAERVAVLAAMMAAEAEETAWRLDHEHRQHKLPARRVRYPQSAIQKSVERQPDDGGKSRPVAGDVDAVRSTEGGVDGKAHPQRQPQLQQTLIPNRQG